MTMTIFSSLIITFFYKGQESCMDSFNLEWVSRSHSSEAFVRMAVLTSLDLHKQKTGALIENGLDSIICDHWLEFFFFFLSDL